jgi:hypothetical protein
LGLATLIAVVAVGGIGFAQFTTSAYLNGNASAGTLGPLTWSNVDTPQSTASYVTCTVTIGTTTNTSDTLEVTATNLAPGVTCTFTADLNNGGSIPANVYSQVVCTIPAGACYNYFSYWDTFSPQLNNGYDVSGGPFGPITVVSGTPLAYTGTVGMFPGLGNEAQGTTCQFVITFTATAGT